MKEKLTKRQKRLQYRYNNMIYPMLGVALALLVAGLIAGRRGGLREGLWSIITSQDMLITDYIEIAGLGAALCNAGLVALVSVALLYFSADPFNGFTMVTVGLMAGFSLFGKNIANIWPILLGSWLYARLKREPFSKYVNVALLSTSLAPLVSFMAFSGHLLLGILTGVVIGFLLPPLSAYTFRIQNGMNLYNMGFACGLLAMLLVPVLKAFGMEPTAALYWATGYNAVLGIPLAVCCVGMIAVGLFCWGKGALQGYRRLLRTSGRASSDYIRASGAGPVLINTGVNGLIAMGYILLIGGDLNGPTVGGILTVMAFSAYGKHARNILPVMAGVLLGSIFNHVSMTSSPSLQLAGLFGTTLAPFAGLFGWQYGVLVGFFHSSVVLYAGLPLEGMNLYNNGFSGGLIAIVLYPVLTSLVRHRKPVLQDRDYFDTFEMDSPIREDALGKRQDEDTPMPH